MPKILILNGPNLSKLGSREPEIYGSTSYTELVGDLTAMGIDLAVETDIRQTNDEAQMISWIHEAYEQKLDVILNPAAFTHYSYALRDACALLTKSGQRLIEVHLSNPSSREEFRHDSVISGVATGTISGMGVSSYRLALSYLAD
ncbi:MAG: type II 3-dehydroquinate dehydratase [Micrococcales bacterium]|nr:type II 3-dehydroquinate dehydratase [Micrococcales bacterium]